MKRVIFFLFSFAMICQAYKKCANISKFYIVIHDFACEKAIQKAQKKALKYAKNTPNDARYAPKRRKKKAQYGQKRFEKHRNHRPRRPRQNHARGRYAQTIGYFQRKSTGCNLRYGLGRPRKRKRYHDSCKKYVNPLQRHENQHH